MRVELLLQIGTYLDIDDPVWAGSVSRQGEKPRLKGYEKARVWAAVEEAREKHPGERIRVIVFNTDYTYYSPPPQASWNYPKSSC